MPRTRFVPEPPIYTFRVRIRGGFSAPKSEPAIWREIEIAANQSLADLGEVIPLAFDFGDPHQWSFFFSGKAWDRSSEYALQSEPGPLVARALVLPVGYASGMSRCRARRASRNFSSCSTTEMSGILGEACANTRSGRAAVQYPRLVASQGEAPPQYPDNEDEDDEDE